MLKNNFGFLLLCCLLAGFHSLAVAEEPTSTPTSELAPVHPDSPATAQTATFFDELGETLLEMRRQNLNNTIILLDMIKELAANNSYQIPDYLKNKVYKPLKNNCSHELLNLTREATQDAVFIVEQTLNNATGFFNRLALQGRLYLLKSLNYLTIVSEKLEDSKMVQLQTQIRTGNGNDVIEENGETKDSLPEPLPTEAPVPAEALDNAVPVQE